MLYIKKNYLYVKLPAQDCTGPGLPKYARFLRAPFRISIPRFPWPFGNTAPTKTFAKNSKGWSPNLCMPRLRINAWGHDP